MTQEVSTEWRKLDDDIDRVLASWLDERVSQRVPQLGRPGPLCPFVPVARRRRSIWICELGDAEAMTALSAAHAFDLLPPGRESQGATHKCALVLLPQGLSAPGVAALADEIKPQLLAKGMTCGNFHPSADDRSARSREVLVADSPTPLLALRYLHHHDRIFLDGHPRYGQLYKRWAGGHV